MPYNDLRKGRVSIPGQIYFLTAVTWGRTPWFEDFQLGRQVAGVFHTLALAHPGLSLAWVVMPDHVHWLVQLPEGLSLDQLMRRFKGRSARALNAARASRGPVWQPGFHDRALRKDEDLLSAARYLIANPLRAGLVPRIADHPLWDAIWIQPPVDRTEVRPTGG